jgi:EmrB/QacA subfamily drug resistance transporter
VHRPPAAFGTLLLLIAQFMLILDSTIVNVALPEIGSELGLSPADLQWVVTAYVVTFGGFLLTGARLGDARGKLPVFLTGITVFTAASLLGGLAPDAGLLIAARAAQGLGAALAAPGALALLVANSRDESSRRAALAMFSAVGVAGGAIGLIAGGVLTELLSWRWTLLINVPLGLFVILFIRSHVSDTARSRGAFDIAGCLLTVATASTLVITLGGMSDADRSPSATLLGIGASVAMFVALILFERRARFPLIRLELTRDRRRAGALLAGALILGGQSSLMFVAIQFLQAELGLSPILAGAVFLPMTAGIFTMSWVIPRLVGRFGPAVPLIVGSLCLAGTYLLFAASVSTRSVPLVVCAMLFNGLAAGLCFMPITSTVLRDVPAELTGSASGLLQTSQNIGSAIAVAGVTALLTAAPSAGALSGFSAAFIGIAGLAIAAFITAFAMVVPRSTRGSSR